LLGYGESLEPSDRADAAERSSLPLGVASRRCHAACRRSNSRGASEEEEAEAEAEASRANEGDAEIGGGGALGLRTCCRGG